MLKDATPAEAAAVVVVVVVVSQATKTVAAAATQTDRSVAHSPIRTRRQRKTKKTAEPGNLEQEARAARIL
jgi:hypothetical protein